MEARYLAQMRLSHWSFGLRVGDDDANAGKDLSKQEMQNVVGTKKYNRI